VRVNILPATWRHRHFPKAAEDSSSFRQFKIVSFITIEEIKIPFSQYYDRKDTLQGRVLVWREKPVLAQAERARSPSGNPENYFWASSSPIFSPQHTQTTIVLTSKWRKRRAVGTQTYWRIQPLYGHLPFDPGYSWGATQCIEIQTQEKQRFPLSANLFNSLW